MQATFVGVKKPYTSAKNGQTYFGGYFTTPNPQAPECVELLDVEMSATIHSKLLGADPGTVLDIDLAPRMFAGKVQGMNVVAVNG